ncbi:MAG: sodium-translocating pyrophosphatase [Phycisphaerae bacterium]|nr:sodium-translocating pyrophosphatase [Phycisphaerae bacterium]
MIGRFSQLLKNARVRTGYLVLLALFFVAVFAWNVKAEPGTSGVGTEVKHSFRFFSPLTDTAKYKSGERIALLCILGVAVLGLLYAAMLAGQVKKADEGTQKMKDIAAAVREGANAYLGAQFKKIGPLIIILTCVLFATKWGSWEFAFGRAGAFLIGSLFSWTVGFVGMRFATSGNLRVAAAARKSYGEAMQLGYRTGTITGMLTDGLGLLGGTIIFLIYGEQAYEALLGFGFGGTLLALFMRVGGGIYTKAADVGADLVGKIEKDIPEDDPRNAATIADNVGDNVGDCAGMAADIFESYEVTIVAAMILGLASFGHKGVIFPLLVRGIGVLGSIISTYTVKAGPRDTSDTALKSVHRGFWIGSAISVIGFVLLGVFYLRFDASMVTAGTVTQTAWDSIKNLPAWLNLGVAGMDMRPVMTCFIGIILAIALNKVTSYYTHTSHAPVKSLARACQTGHATNIIQGFAVGYESAVAATVVIAVSVALSVLCYWGTPAVFIAYGVAMTGIGMLTLTGNTISMDVFGPVADNANGIGEMGYDKAEMEKAEPGSYKRARQVLADLDAVGNTTKAETKGIAIGSAVIAAVSLFASFIAVIAVGSEENLSRMTEQQYQFFAAKLSIAAPMVLIGFLIGGTVPFLFSSMLIRAVGRAAFFIVKECRVQFQDKEIWAGTKKPDYGRVVGICTSTAQKELVGPGLLALLAPMLVGFLLGPYALGGFLAGMILVGQLLAVFMANAGGAWDNAKKMVEDGMYGGKGSDAHRASVTGDTVGDPLKDTAGPAINPLVKVMNMVSLLGLGLVLSFNASGVNPDTGKITDALKAGASLATLQAIKDKPTDGLIGLIVVLVAIMGICWAVWRSKHETPEMKAMDQEPASSQQNPKH